MDDAIIKVIKNYAFKHKNPLINIYLLMNKYYVNINNDTKLFEK